MPWGKVDVRFHGVSEEIKRCLIIVIPLGKAEEDECVVFMLYASATSHHAMAVLWVELV